MTKFMDSVSDGLKYPWNNPGRLWNILWLLVPIIGWFALAGYVKQIVRTMIKSQTKEIPKMHSFWNCCKDGFIIMVFMIPTMIALSLIGMIPFAGRILMVLAEVFILPWLIMNFFMKEEIDALWEIKPAFYKVFNNGVEYMMAYFKTLIYSVVYGILCVFLVGIPCTIFGSFYFLSEFYSKHN